MMNSIARGEKNISELLEYVAKDAERHPENASRLMFTSNHDENSWSGSEFTRMGDAVKVMVALTFVLPQGLPLIYTGQEVGYDHSFEFFDRDPLPSLKPNEWSDFYRTLAALKHRSAALDSGENGGSFVEIRNNAEDCLMTFVREKENSRVVCIMNVSPWHIHTDYHTGIYAGEYRDSFTGEKVVLHEHVERDMSPWSFEIIEQNW